MIFRSPHFVILRSALLLLALTQLWACGHFKDQSSAPSGTWNDGSITESTENTETSRLPSTYSYEAKDENLTVTAEPIDQNDLLARIKAGFALPEYQSHHIQSYEQWNTRHATYLADLFKRAEPFLYYIVEEVEKRKLPMEIALLPAVESAFKPRAYSRSRASGLWQFIPSTGRHFKLRQDWWYDGRLDAISATTAALDYLEELNALFDGDWFLTLAAYNAGQGTIAKAIRYNKRKGRGTRYQDLKLKAETERYVPKLFAFRNIISEPERFGVELPFIPNQPHFEIIQLPGQIDLYEFAKRASIDLEVLQHLNAGHKRWASSPDGPHRLLIPLQFAQQSRDVLAQMKLAPSVKYRDHQIQQGDTLSGIARRYGVNVTSLKQTNNLTNSRIRAGRTLLIPIPQKSSAVVQANNQGSDQDGGQGSNTTARSGANSADQGSIVHRVVAGDTLWSIARRYKVQVAQLASWNKLSSNQILSLDQSLLVFPNQRM